VHNDAERYQNLIYRYGTATNACADCCSNEWTCLCSQRCPAGTYQDEIGQSSCKTCIAGKYQHNNSEDNSGEGSIGPCYECASGTYQDEVGQFSCKTCVGGKYSDAGQSSCKSCVGGKYSDAGTGQITENVCKSCVGGKYSDAGTGQITESVCKSCIDGTYSIAGASSCPFNANSCPPGSYASGVACDACGTGKYQDQSGQTSEYSCKSCGTGQYNNQQGQSSCKTCASGQFQNQSGHSSCKNCTQATYSIAGASSCPFNVNSCPAETHASGTASCEPCPTDTYSTVGAVSALHCCQANYFYTTVGCTRCPWRGQCYLFDDPDSRSVVVDFNGGRKAYTGKRYTLTDWIQGNTQTNVGLYLYDAPVGLSYFKQNCDIGNAFVQTESQCRDVAWFTHNVTDVSVTQDQLKRVGCYSTPYHLFSFNTHAIQLSNVDVKEWCSTLV
jgi:hypothetical protein